MASDHRYAFDHNKFVGKVAFKEDIMMLNNIDLGGIPPLTFIDK